MCKNSFFIYHNPGKITALNLYIFLFISLAFSQKQNDFEITTQEQGTCTKSQLDPVSSESIRSYSIWIGLRPNTTDTNITACGVVNMCTIPDV